MFKLHCDRCNRYIKQVGGPEAKTLSLDGNDILCKKCKDFEDKMNKTAEKLKTSWNGKIEKLISEAKAELTKNLKGE